MSENIPRIQWRLFPEKDVRTGVSIFIVANTDLPLEDGVKQLVARLSPVTAGAGLSEPIELRLEPSGSKEWTKEFTLMLPGDYSLELGHRTQVFHVASQEYLSFGSEFGLFSGVVLLLVGGMLIWLIKSKRISSVK